MAYILLAHDDKYLREVNNARKQLGLGPVVKLKRNCLKCEKEFIAIGRVNRLCYGCGNRANGHE